MPTEGHSTLFLSDDEPTKYDTNVAWAQEHLVAVKRLQQEQVEQKMLEWAQN